MQYRWRWLDILHDVFHCAGRKMQLMWHMHRMGNRRCNSKLSFVSFLQSARRNRLRRQRNPWIFDKSCLVFCLTFLALEYWFEKKTCCYFDIVFFFMWKHHREAERVSFAAGGSLLRIAPSFVFIRLSDFSRGRGLLRSLFVNHFSLFCLLVFTSRRYLLYVHYYTRWSKCIQLMASWCMDWAVRFGSLPLFISVAFALYGLDGDFKRSRGTKRKQFELGCCEGTKRHCRHMIRLFGGGSWTWISLKRWFNADLCVWDSTLELLRFLASARSSLAS